MGSPKVFIVFELSKYHDHEIFMSAHSTKRGAELKVKDLSYRAAAGYNIHEVELKR